MARRPRETPRDAPGVRKRQTRPNSQHPPMLATMTNHAPPPMLAKTTNLARPTDAAIRSTYRSYRERSADRGLNGAASALLLARCFRWRCRRWRGYNVYRSSLTSRRGARNAKKAERVQSAVNTEYVYSCEFYVFVCMGDAADYSLFTILEFSGTTATLHQNRLFRQSVMMVKLWFG